MQFHTCLIINGTYFCEMLVQVTDYHDFLEFSPLSSCSQTFEKVPHSSYTMSILSTDVATKRTLLRFYCPVIRSLYTCARSVFARATSARGSVTLQIRPDRERTRDTERDEQILFHRAGSTEIA